MYFSFVSVVLLRCLSVCVWVGRSLNYATHTRHENLIGPHMF